MRLLQTLDEGSVKAVCSALVVAAQKPEPKPCQSYEDLADVALAGWSAAETEPEMFKPFRGKRKPRHKPMDIAVPPIGVGDLFVGPEQTNRKGMAPVIMRPRHLRGEYIVGHERCVMDKETFWMHVFCVTDRRIWRDTYIIGGEVRRFKNRSSACQFFRSLCGEVAEANTVRRDHRGKRVTLLADFDNPPVRCYQ